MMINLFTCDYARRASLYERPVNLDSAKAAHADFRRVMREHGVKVGAFSGLAMHAKHPP